MPSALCKVGHNFGLGAGSGGGAVQSMLSYAKRGKVFVDDAQFLLLLLLLSARSMSFSESHSSVPSLSAVLALQIIINKHCALLLSLVVEAVAGREINALFSVLFSCSLA